MGVAIRIGGLAVGSSGSSFQTQTPSLFTEIIDGILVSMIKRVRTKDAVELYAVDLKLTDTGFAGVEGIDYEMIYGREVISGIDVFWTPKYFVSNTGNDALDGLSPVTAWQTIAKVNATSFVAGDTIGFKKGNVWRETLTVPSSGDVDNPITFGAYGSGTNPIIDGTDLISDWVPASGSWNNGISLTYSWYLGAAANYNVRNVIAANSCVVDGVKVRMSFKANAGGNAVITGASIGLMTTGGIFDSAPVRITFDGGSASTTITAGTTKVSDIIDFAFDKTLRYGIHIFTTQRQYLSILTEGSKYYGNTGDNTLTLTSPGSGPAAGFQMIDKFEILTADIPNVYDATIALVNPNLVFNNDIFQTKGISAGGLNNHEWFFAGGVLSYRNDEGAPTGMSGTLRPLALSTNNKIYVVINSSLIVKYGNYKRFMDNRIANIFGEWSVEPTILLSDDLTRMHIWLNHKYGYTDDGLKFSALVATDFPAGYACGGVVKDGGVYYMTMAHFGATTYDYINVFSSNNGINWTDLGTIIPLGAGGAWDDTGIGNSFVWKEGGVWYILYEARGSSGGYQIGLSTADTIDGAWTKYGGNPLISGVGEGAGNPELVMINNVVTKFDGYYYMIYQYDNTGSAHNIMRAKSLDLHTWIVEGPILDYRIPPTAPGTSNCDQTVVQFKGKSYLFYSGNMNGGGANAHIDVCIDNRPLSEILALTP